MVALAEVIPQRKSPQSKRREKLENMLQKGEVFPTVSRGNRWNGNISSEAARKFDCDKIVRKERLVIVRMNPYGDLEMSIQTRSPEKPNYPRTKEIFSEHPNINPETKLPERRMQTFERGLREEINFEGQLAFIDYKNEFVEKPSTEDHRGYWIDTSIAISKEEISYKVNPAEVETFDFFPISHVKKMFEKNPEQFIPLTRLFLQQFLQEDTINHLKTFFEPQVFNKLRFKQFPSRR